MLKRAAMAGVLAAAVLVGGCHSQSKSVVVQDDTALRQADALRLATEAQKAQKAGDSDRAVDLYRQSLERSRDLYPVWNNLALLLMQRQDYIHASEAFLTAADLAPYDPRPMYNVGVIYQETRHDQEALKFFNQSLARDPKYLPSIRGAVASAKLLDLTDDESLARVESGLMLETDPTWRMIFEKELLRIKGTLGRKPDMVPVPADQESLNRRFEQLTGGRLQPSDPVFIPKSVPGNAPAPSGEPQVSPPQPVQPQPVQPPPEQPSPNQPQPAPEQPRPSPAPGGPGGE